MKRLKEERIGFDNQLAAIERTLKAKEKDLEELVLMSHDAQVRAAVTSQRERKRGANDGGRSGWMDGWMDACMEGGRWAV